MGFGQHLQLSMGTCNKSMAPLELSSLILGSRVDTLVD